VPALVNPISFWELAVLEQRGRIAVDRDLVRWTRDLLASGKVEVTHLTPSAAIAAAVIGGLQCSHICSYIEEFQ
jgi:PIN domain nuclease of toxin-antitoxin system